MKLLITAEMVKDGLYIGAEIVDGFDGHIEIAADLGRVRFSGAVRATASIVANAGSGIEAGWGIEAGEGIEAGWGIKAGESIKAGWGIEAGWGIKAGSGIEAGEGIKAGEGIEAGFSITCSGVLRVGLRIFAGLCAWQLPTDEQRRIRCGQLASGVVAFGELIESEKQKAEGAP